MRMYNYDNAIEILRDTFWVGFYDEGADLHCNPYLLVDHEAVILFDPGSIPHFPIVFRKVLDVVNPREITAICLSHQDPDVAGNIAVVEDVIDRNDLKIITHSSNVRMIQHYGVKSNFYEVDKHDYKLTLTSGRVLEFIYTPYLHSPFSIITYDTKNRTLFSSDLFGAISKDWDLFARGDSFDGMDAWHKFIIPNNQILKSCMEKLERRKIDRILPQHGSIIEGDGVMKAIERLKNLPCGVDLDVSEIP